MLNSSLREREGCEENKGLRAKKGKKREKERESLGSGFVLQPKEGGRRKKRKKKKERGEAKSSAKVSLRDE